MHKTKEYNNGPSLVTFMLTLMMWITIKQDILTTPE